MSSASASLESRPSSELRVDSLGAQVARFAGVGVVSSVVHLGLFAGIREVQGTQVANLLALVVATCLNTALNRSWTFRVRGPERIAQHQLQSLLVFAGTWAASGGALALLAAMRPGSSTALSTVVLGVSMGMSTAARFAAMRMWIFRDRQERPPARPIPSP